MSDLQCPATILVARHAQATYRHPDSEGAGDGGRLTTLGEQQVARLGESVRPRRIAAVYTSGLSRAVQTGQLLGAALGVDSTVLPGVEEFSVGEYADRSDAEDLIRAVFDRWLTGEHDARCPGGESAAEVAARFWQALTELADLYRGETVVVVSHRYAMSLALPRLCGNVPEELTRAHWLPHCCVAEVFVGADGWELRDWPGSVDPPAARDDRGSPRPVPP